MTLKVELLSREDTIIFDDEEYDKFRDLLKGLQELLGASKIAFNGHGKVKVNRGPIRGIMEYIEPNIYGN